MKITQYHTQIIENICQYYIEHYHFLVNYYNDINDPEYRFKHGISLEQKRIQVADDFVKESQNIKSWVSAFDCFEAEAVSDSFLNQYQLIEAVKQVIRRSYVTAYKYTNNKYMFWSNLKRSVIALDLLKLNCPEYKEVHPRFFVNYNHFH